MTNQADYNELLRKISEFRVYLLAERQRNSTEIFTEFSERFADELRVDRLRQIKERVEDVPEDPWWSEDGTVMSYDGGVIADVKVKWVEPFITQAPSDVRWLLAEVERLQGGGGRDE